MPPKLLHLPGKRKGKRENTIPRTDVDQHNIPEIIQETISSPAQIYLLGFLFAICLRCEAGPSKRTPTHVPRPRPESEEEDDEEGEGEENGSESGREELVSRQPQEPPRTKTPSVYHWKVDVLAADS